VAKAAGSAFLNFFGRRTHQAIPAHKLPFENILRD
jgi:hypothetical protein